MVHVPDDVLLQGCDGQILNALTPPPSCLFHHEDRSLLRCLKARQAIAVIGTRSLYSLQMADRLGRALLWLDGLCSVLQMGLMRQRTAAAWQQMVLRWRWAPSTGSTQPTIT